jgi:hypothetical protein
MKSSFILFRRGSMFYCENTATGKQQSLRTKDAAEAQTLLHSKNEAARQPFLKNTMPAQVRSQQSTRSFRKMFQHPSSSAQER